MNKKMIILVVVTVVIISSIYYLEQSKVKPQIQEPLQETIPSTIPAQGTPPLKATKYPLAPELTGISGYLNTDGKDIKISDYKGKVVLVDFWTYTCINCIRTLPHLTEWDNKYKNKGLVIIGVHTPEFEFEKKTENVQNAIEKYNIEYAVVQDDDYATWQAYKNRYWPHKYLIDKEGYIRYDHIGEGGYEETEQKIQELLAEIDGELNQDLSTVEDTTPQFPTTPELYAGYSFALPRGQNIGNEEGLQPDKSIRYQVPEGIKGELIYLDGQWKSNADNLEAIENNASVFLNFVAASVNIVANTVQEPVKMEVFLNGEYITPPHAGKEVRFDGERAFIVVDTPQLYTVVDGNYGRYTLRLTVEKGFTFNAFTFG